eukprot:gene8865-11959_t
MIAFNKIFRRDNYQLIWTEPEDICYGEELTAVQLCARAAGDNVIGEFTYTPSFGQILPAGDHLLHVKFSPHGFNNFFVEKTVMIHIIPIESVLSWNILPQYQTISYGNPLNENQLCALCTNQPVINGTYVYNPIIGTILDVGEHEISVVFHPINIHNIESAYKIINIKVVKGIPKIEWYPPSAIIYGEKLSNNQLNARCIGSDAENNHSPPLGYFIYDPPINALLDVGHHVLSTTFIPFDDDNYESIEEAVEITIEYATPSIIWNNPSSSIEYNTPLNCNDHLNACCVTENLKGEFIYDPPEGTILEIGEHKLRVLFNPWQGTYHKLVTNDDNNNMNYNEINDDISINDHIKHDDVIDNGIGYNYNSIKKEIKVIVKKLTPVLQWYEPAPIYYGTLLSDLQLNAECIHPLLNVSNDIGELQYHPTFGTKLDVGKYKLSVFLMPYHHNLDKYEPSERYTVHLLVHPVDPIIIWNIPIMTIPYGHILDESYLCAIAVTVNSSNFTTGYLEEENNKIVQVEESHEIIEGDYEYDPPLGSKMVDISNEMELQVIFYPYDSRNYSTAEKTVIIKVIKHTPFVDIKYPTTIDYGYSLDDCGVTAECVDDILQSMDDMDDYDNHKKSVGTFQFFPPLDSILEPGEHQLRVVFIPSDTTHYAIAVKTVNLIVLTINAEFTYHINNLITTHDKYDNNDDDFSIYYCTPLLIMSHSELAGEFQYEPEINSILPVGNHEIKIVFKPYEHTRYKQSLKTCTLKVLKYIPSVSWNIPHSYASLDYDEPLSSNQLCATLRFDINDNHHLSKLDIAGMMCYDPPLDAILRVGDHQLSVVFRPEDNNNYEESSPTYNNIVIRPKQLVLEWNLLLANKSIDYGEPLSDIYFNAVCYLYKLDNNNDNNNVIFDKNDRKQVQGLYHYSHPIGTILHAGNHELTVQFTPHDSHNYIPPHEISHVITVNKNGNCYSLEWNDDKQYNNDNVIFYGTLLSSNEYNIVMKSTVKDEVITIDYISERVTLTVNGNNNGNVIGSIEFTPPLGTLLDSGIHELIATFVPLDSHNYDALKQTKQLKINRINLEIIWNQLLPVLVGTLLTEDHCNAKCVSLHNGLDVSGDGVFTYNPPMGNIMNNAGENKLFVEFIHNNKENYNIAVSHIILMVQKLQPLLYYDEEFFTKNQNSNNNNELFVELSFGTLITNYILHIRLREEDSHIRGNFVIKIQEIISFPSSARIEELESFHLETSFLPVGQYKLIVLFKPVDESHYYDATMWVTVIINKFVPSISWDINNKYRVLYYGDPLTTNHLCARCNNMISNIDNNVAQIDVKGMLLYDPPLGTILQTGQHTLTATFIPTDNNNIDSIKQTQTIEILPIQLEIEWILPLHIIYGEILDYSFQQAQVTRNGLEDKTDGYFQYSFEEDEILPVGKHILEAIFYPEDEINYLSINKTVTIEVMKKNPVIEWDVCSGMSYGQKFINKSKADIDGIFKYKLLLPDNDDDNNNNINNNDNSNIDNNSTLPILSKDIAISCEDDANLQSFFDLSSIQFNCGYHKIIIIFIPNNQNYYSKTKEFILKVHRAMVDIIWDVPSSIEYGHMLSAEDVQIAYLDDYTIEGDIKYDNINHIINVSLDCNIKYSFSLTFYPKDVDNYLNPIIITRELQVTIATPCLEWDLPSDIIYGEVLSNKQLNAKIIPSKNMKNSNANNAMNHIEDSSNNNDSNNNINPHILGMFRYNPPLRTKLVAGCHELNVTFEPYDQTLYNNATKSVNIIVRKCSPVVVWEHNNINNIATHENDADDNNNSVHNLRKLKYGLPLTKEEHLNARCTKPIGLLGQFLYDPPDSTILNAGVHIITCTFIPEDQRNYESITTNIQIAVESLSSNIIWNSYPSTISYGTPLTAAHLNAIAVTIDDNVPTFDNNNDNVNSDQNNNDNQYNNDDNNNNNNNNNIKNEDQNEDHKVVDERMTIPGHFVYNPPVGTVLDAGEQWLSVTFYPSNNDNITISTHNVPIIVTKLTPQIIWINPDKIEYETPLSELQLNAIIQLPYNIYIPDNKDTPNENNINENNHNNKPKLKHINKIKGDFIYDPPIGSILPCGIQELKVTFFPKNQTNFQSCSAVVHLFIYKYVPIIQWKNYIYNNKHESKIDDRIRNNHNPDDIIDNSLTELKIPYGTLLDESHLNAYLIRGQHIPGYMRYDPTVGALLSVGKHKLNVRFVPNERINYKIIHYFIFIIISPIKPILFWPPPLPITYGTPLSSLQLNAMLKSEYEKNLNNSKLENDDNNNYNYNSPNHRSSLILREKLKSSRLSLINQSNGNNTTPTLSYQKLVSKSVSFDFQGVGVASPTSKQGYGSMDPFIHSNDNGYSRSQSDDSYDKNNFILGEFIYDPPIESMIPIRIKLESPLLRSLPGFSSINSIPGTFDYYITHSKINIINKVLPIGHYKITAKFHPNDSTNFNDEKFYFHIIILKSIPYIIWNQPVGLVHIGSILSNQILNAIAVMNNYHDNNSNNNNSSDKIIIDGRYDYNPSIGTILSSAGVVELRVDFYPNNNHIYDNIFHIINITVNKYYYSIRFENSSPRDDGVHVYDMVYGEVLTGHHLDGQIDPVQSHDEFIQGSFHYHAKRLNYDNTHNNNIDNNNGVFDEISPDFDLESLPRMKLDAGIYSIRCSFIPSDHYDKYESSCIYKQLKIDKATPTVSWNPPTVPHVYHGDSLPIAYMNAICQEAMLKKLTGSFHYHQKNHIFHSINQYELITAVFIPSKNDKSFQNYYKIDVIASVFVNDRIELLAKNKKDKIHSFSGIESTGNDDYDNYKHFNNHNYNNNNKSYNQGYNNNLQIKKSNNYNKLLYQTINTSKLNDYNNNNEDYEEGGGG